MSPSKFSVFCIFFYHRCYQQADTDKLPEVISTCMTLFKSDAMFLLLSNLTGLKLHELAAASSDEENSDDNNKGDDDSEAGTSNGGAKKTEKKEDTEKEGTNNRKKEGTH